MLTKGSGSPVLASVTVPDTEVYWALTIEAEKLTKSSVRAK
jgi:hypothetical protein